MQAAMFDKDDWNENDSDNGNVEVSDEEGYSSMNVTKMYQTKPCPSWKTTEDLVITGFKSKIQKYNNTSRVV